MNSLTQDDVIEVLKIIDESKYDELHLETGDLKLIVRRGSGGSAHVQELTTLKDTSKRLDDGREVVSKEFRRKCPHRVHSGWFLSSKRIIFNQLEQ